MNLHWGYPFWLIKDGLPYGYPKLQQSLSTDVIILGGGISGALTAYYLTKVGMDCVVLDARTIGLGSTCASTSLLQYEIDTPLYLLKNIVGYQSAVRAYKLCGEAIEKIAAIAKELNFTDFNFKKSLYYAVDKKHVPFLKEECTIRKENGFDVDFLDEQTIKDEFHFSAPGAILSHLGAHINAYLFTHALLQHGLQNGLQVYDRTPVKEIENTNKGVTLKTDNNCIVKAKKLVHATGYEAIHFIKKKIVTLYSTYATITEQFNKQMYFWKDDAMIWNTAKPYLYVRSVGNNRILVGGRDEKFINIRRQDKLINKKTKSLAKDFCMLFQNIPFIPEFSWAGVFGATKDGLPFIGSYKKLPNSFFALGYGGNGITFSVVAAEILTDIIKGKQNSDAKIFSFERI